MKCPKCGRETPVQSVRCGACQALLPASVYSGRVTAVSVDSDETVFLSGASPHHDAETVFGGDGIAAAHPVSAPQKAVRGPLEDGQPFGSRYRILRQLGVGGMGAVYQAWDDELGVAVALKVIRPEVTRDATAAQDIERRFKQELLLARQVTHKNVVRIHDLGELDGIKYITMPYIKGSDLATVLRDQHLAVPKVMTLARQIAAGLQAAHEAGVVHRDLKPANVMIDGDNNAIIMDFGIARSTSRVGGTPARPAGAGVGAGTFDLALDTEMTRAAETIAGEVIGTIEYMAPEQARGEHVDQRADVYAFGLILYDMLAGRRRSEHAVSAVGELQKRLAQPPPSVRSIIPNVPQALDQLVTRCTEPDAAKRFQTTAELVASFDLLDDNGKLRPVKRVVRLPVAVSVGLLLLTLSGFIWWYTQPPVQRDQVAVVIADFANSTGDAAFDRTLEPVLQRGLAEAGFISAFDRNAIRSTLGVQPPEKLDEEAARNIALKQGLGVYLVPAIARRGNGFELSVKTAQTVSGSVVATTSASAANKEQVARAVTELVTDVRSALGDEASESDQLTAMASLSVTSLDVLGHYSAAVAASSNNDFEGARRSLLEAVKVDPKFGVGYQLLAVASRNLGQLQDAEKYINQALEHVGTMTERERYGTRGFFYRLTGDYEQCVKEYSDLIARYAADVAGHNQLALCASKLRNLRLAVDEMQRVVALLPNRATFRDNLALYSNYLGDFRTAEQEARKVPGPDVYATLALAFAQLGQNQRAEAMQTYQKLASMGGQGASFAAVGLGDFAIVEGRYTDAVKILRDGAAADEAAKSNDTAAVKFASLARAHLLLGDNGAARAAADQALALSKTVAIRFQAGRVYIEAGQIGRALLLVNGLAKELQTEPQAYAKILEGEIALRNKDPRRAIKVLGEANTLLDTWIGHFDLGRAYLDAEQFIQADSEFDRCLKRRGEAMSLFLDEVPTYGYLPPVFYYQGRVREAMKNVSAPESYREYVNLRGTSNEDSLLADAKRRAGL